MGTSDDNSKLVKRFAKNLMGVIVLLAVFACGFAAIVLHFGENIKTHDCLILLLIFILALLPLITICILSLLLIGCTCNKKSYINFQASNKDNVNVSISVEKATEASTKEAVNLLKEILENLSKTNSEQK